MKQAVKTIASSQGRTATFMAKPDATWSGNSGHLHLSLWNADGTENLFTDGPANTLERRRLPGHRGHARDDAGGDAVLLSEPESATSGSCPYMWGSTTKTWGLENRTVGLRVIESSKGV